MNVTFYADQLIERYNLDGLDQLSDGEVKLLWHEVSTGMKILNFEKFHPMNLEKLIGMKLSNMEKLAHLCKVVKERKVKRKESRDKAGNGKRKLVENPRKVSYWMNH